MNRNTKSGTTTGDPAPGAETAASFPFALIALNVVVAVFGVVGIVVASLTFARGGNTAADDHFVNFDGGAAAATSFGSIFVEHLETLDGLSADQLGGMTHGIGDLVEHDDAQVSVAVLLANLSDRPVRVDTGDYAIFVDGIAEPFPPSSSTLQPLTLAPGSSVDVTVTFVVPRTGAEISMGYADPDGPVIFVPVGRVDQAPIGVPANDHDDDDHGDDDHDHGDHEDNDH